MDKIPTPNFDSIDPTACVNAKLRRLHRLINATYQQKINSFGLKGSMLSILFIIGKKPKVNQKVIAEALVLDQSTMSRDLKKLIHKGLVKKSKGADARYKELILTKQGYELLEEITPVWQALHTKVQTILGQHNLQQIDGLIYAIRSNLEEIKA